MSAKRARKYIGAITHGRHVRCDPRRPSILVNRLLAKVRAGVRRACDVCSQYSKIFGCGYRAGVLLDEPDEAGPEHGGCGSDEGGPEGIEG